MKTTLPEVGKKAVLPQIVLNLPYGRHMTLTRVFGVNENAIQVHNDEDIELLGQDLIGSSPIRWRVQMASPGTRNGHTRS